jgi:hypothetical protein
MVTRVFSLILNQLKETMTGRTGATISETGLDRLNVSER